MLNSKIGEKEIVIKELQKKLNKLTEQEALKEVALNRIQKEFREEKSQYSQKIASVEKYILFSVSLLT